MRDLIVALSAVGLCGFGACEATVTVPSFEDEGFDPLGEWEVDPSNDTSSAFEIAPEDLGVGAATAGTVFTETIYPKFDDDYWKVPVAEPGQLIQVRAQYQKNASPIRLAVDWIGPRDLCTPASMTACTSSAECAGGGLCDPGRGGCRAARSEPCAGDPHCAAAESCRRGAEDAIATVVEAQATMQHLVLATLPAHVEGDYFIRIYDRDNVESDAETEYELQVGILPDPDLAEMNDAPNMATPIGNNDSYNGFFSYRGDVDYYRIDPGADAGVSDAAVIRVEVRWPAGSGSKPEWTIDQVGRQFISTKLPRLHGSENIHGATFVLPTADPIVVKVENPDGQVDLHQGYEVTVNVFGDPNEGAHRDDLPQEAVAVDMTSFGTAHDASHTIIAENDLDWYRIDRGATSDNTLMYMRARANSDDIMLAVLVFEATPNMACNPSEQSLCGGGQQCVCPFSGTCGAGEGVCLRPWAQRPLPNDPNHPPEFGGRTPNDIQLQLPIFDAGPGALWVQVGHLQQVYPPRAGHSATDSYSLTFEHRQEPHVFDRSAGKNEYQPLPLGVSEGTWVSNRRVEGTFSLGQTVSGYISYEGDQDWFRFTTGAPVGMADLHFTNTAGMNLRVQVRRGGNKVGANGDLDADSACTHMYSGDSTIDVWVNDNDFDEWNISTPYSFTLDIVPGCIEPQCHMCRCRPDQGCGCGEPAPNECGSCDGSVVDLGCGCGNPAPVDGAC